MNSSAIPEIGFNGEALARQTKLKAETVATKKIFNARIAILTAGRDKPYALGLAEALIAAGENLDFICGDEFGGAEFRESPRVNVLNLRGDQRVEAGMMEKISRVLIYYWRLIRYAATARPEIFHILWNNKFELFDRTALMLYYKLLGKKIVFTAHNINIRKRDGRDSLLNRLTLKIQYRLSDHIFVHTEKMKGDLVSDFGVSEKKVSVIPLGINNSVPNTSLNGLEAREKLDLSAREKVILFFGQIAPYKGLEFLIAAFEKIAKNNFAFRLAIVGRPKGPENYWNRIRELILKSGLSNRILQKIEFVPDAETEIFFKAADVLVLPYVHIFQSGVLFLGYSFGLPVIAADVGSLKEEIVEGKTGLIFEPRNEADLATKIQNYFESDLYRELKSRRHEIQDFANERYSWSKVVTITTAVYSKLLEGGRADFRPAIHCENR